MTDTTPSADAWFSPGALQQLRVAVDHRLAAPSEDPHEGIRAACRRLREEARARRLSPADLVKAVRGISLQTVHGEAWSKSRDVRYYRLLDDCLTAYFEADDGSPATRE